MEKKRNPLFYLVVMILFMSCILSLFAKPLSRNSASEINKEQAVQFGKQDQVANTQGGVMEEQHHGRMGIEVNDYPGSGPNTRHDPKSPGTP